MSDRGSVEKSRVMMGILVRTIVLVILLAVALVFLQSTIVFIPGISAVVLFFIASVARIALSGKYAVPLCRFLQVLGITLFCVLLISAPELRAEARGLGLPILLLGVVWAIHFLSKAYSDLTGVTTRALIIALAGNLYYSLLAASGVLFLPQLASVVLIAFTAAAAFSFVGVLSRHSNPRVSFVGKAFAGLWNPGVIGAAVAVVMTYLAFIRPSLVAFGPMAVTVIEWAAMCVVIFWLFRKIRSALRADEALGGGKEFGDGHKVTGELHYEKGDLEKAAAKVGEFVEKGRKDGLITLTAMALARNGVPPETVENVISIVLNYAEDPVPPIALRWAVGDREAAGRHRRERVAEAMLAAAVAAISTDSGRGDSGVSAGPENTLPAIPAR